MTLCDKCVKQPYCDIYEDIMNYEQDSGLLPDECQWFKPHDQDQDKELESKLEKKEPCQKCKWYGLPIQLDLIHTCLECRINDYKWFKSRNCKNCDNCFDNGDTMHFNVCKIYGGCVDCDPFQCDGKDWISKNLNRVK